MHTIMHSIAAALILVSGAEFASAAAGTDYTQPLRDDSTYRAFGEKPGLVRIMDDFMINLMADARINSFFKETDQARLKTQLVDQFCEILAGPCKYQGAAMAPMHRELGVNTAHFNALVEALQAAMSKHGVPNRAQNVLLAKLAPMQRDVITK